MNDKLLEILACPMCKATPLRFGQTSTEEVLTCSLCAERYIVEKGIPDMLPREFTGDLSSPNGEWRIWSRKLQNFIQWRKTTWNGSPAAIAKASHVDEIKEKFILFTSLRDSGKKVLDVGCGDGGLKTLLGDCDYHGTDPLLIQGRQYYFPMVRGVGERLAFRDCSFDAVVLNQVLDHCNSIDEVVRESARVITGDGALYVMQYLSETGSFANRIYKAIIERYHSIQGCSDPDVKTRRFNMKRLIAYFRERFGKVDCLEYSPSQLFIHAEQPQKRFLSQMS